MERVTTKTNRPAQAEALSPFAAALAAFRAAAHEADRLSGAADAAEEASRAFERTALPRPAILTRRDGKPITIVANDRTEVIEPSEYAYSSAEVIQASDIIPEAEKPAMIAALAAWEAEQLATDAATGYSAVVSAEAAAHSRWMAAYRRAERAGLAVLRTPISSAAEVAAKRKIIREYFDHFVGDDATVIKALLDAALPPSAPSEPPPTSGGGDPAADAYVEARASASAYAHHGEAYAPADDAEERAADALLSTAPTSLRGIAIRLGYVVSQAFIHTAGDWDCPACYAKRLAVVPPTDGEFCGCGEGQNGGADALFRGLAFLHQGVERLAGIAQPPVADEDALANSRPEDREPAARPFDVATATTALLAAGVHVWPGIGFWFPGGLGEAAQQALADLTEAEKAAIIDRAATENILADAASGAALAGRATA